MPATATDPVKMILNQAEAIVRIDPEKQTQKMKELGEYVSPGTVRGGYISSQEWLFQRKPTPSADKIFKIKAWVDAELAKLKRDDKQTYNNIFDKVCEERR